jgi:hypothetical protein
LKKWILGVLVVCLMCFGASVTRSQNDEFQTKVITGTSDIIMDSTLTSTYMKGKRLYINGIYWWYDNAANTNQMFVQVVSGGVNLITQGAGRNFLYSEAMTSAGIKGTSMPLNVTTSPDSTIYFIISGTGSDSLYMAVNYKFVGK